MSSLEAVRTCLREVWGRSIVVKYLRESKANWAGALARARALSAEEIAALELQENLCENWAEVKVLGPAALGNIRRCRFEGPVILRGEGGAPKLWNSRFRDCLIGAAQVEDCPLVRCAWIEDGAFLRNVGEFSGLRNSRFGLGDFLRPGSESGARKVFRLDGLTVSDCAAMAALTPAEQDAFAAELEAALTGLESDRAYVGAKARLEHVPLMENCFLGAGATVRGAASLQTCVLASTLDDPIHVGEGSIVSNAVLDPGVGIHHGAQVHRSLLLEYSGADRAGQVSDSVLGPGTHAAQGEITASLVGPFTGFHHQALLIGALWPEGRGNVGYGANVGSNHTGRKPDQEIRPGEGVFFGLGCSIKFPANFEAAPYSLFATGVLAAPQKITFPFSLITPGESAVAGSAGLNEILPGWMWGENAYALVRNAYKYADRNRAHRHPVPATSPPEGSPLAGTFLAADLFAPRVSDAALHALKALSGLSEAPDGLRFEKEIPGLGKNFLRASRLDKARAAYRDYLSFALCRALLWNNEAGKLSEGRPLLQALNLSDERSLDAAALFRGFAAAVEASLAKDTERGREIFEDYEAFHPAPETDPVCLRLRADLDRLQSAWARRAAR